MELTRTGSIALIRLKAGKANAINPTVLDGLSRLFDEFEAGDARAVVLTGYDRFFSAGLDLPFLSGLKRKEMAGFLRQFESVFLRIFSHPKPVVAAVNGHAVAGGCVLALLCDHRVMVNGDFKIGLNETALAVGLPSIVIEALRSRIPPAAFGPVAVSGWLHTPDQARDLGLVNELSDDVERRAIEKAEELGSVPSMAYAQIKSALLHPALENFNRDRDRNAEAWLDTWFSDEARTRISKAMEQLKGKSR